MATVRRSRGFPKAFSDAQNQALRLGLRELRKKRDCSQVALGQTLGVVQQAIGRLLKSNEAGFSYETATRLVRALGYASVDTFFRAKNVATPSEAPPHAKSA